MYILYNYARDLFYILFEIGFAGDIGSGQSPLVRKGWIHIANTLKKWKSNIKCSKAIFAKWLFRD